MSVPFTEFFEIGFFAVPSHLDPIDSNHILHGTKVMVGHKRHGNALTAHAARSARSVRVKLMGPGKVIVDHVGHM